jgi:hypothetical protein
MKQLTAWTFVFSQQQGKGSWLRQALDTAVECVAFKSLEAAMQWLCVAEFQHGLTVC